MRGLRSVYQPALRWALGHRGYAALFAAVIFFVGGVSGHDHRVGIHAAAG